jgi:hypothetical protein
MDVILPGLCLVPIIDEQYPVLFTLDCNHSRVILISSPSAKPKYHCNMNIIDVYLYSQNINTNRLLIYNYYLYFFVFHYFIIHIYIK